MIPNSQRDSQGHPLVDPSLPFTSPWLLAPMDGVTDPLFRALVMRRHKATDLGGAFTEFVRISDAAAPRRLMKKNLGDERFAMPVGLQLMGRNPELMARSARHAAEVGAPLVDVNFGCPAKGAQKGCAGSALLDHPDEIEAILSAIAKELDGKIPLTAKIRAGTRDDRGIEEIARATENGGAAMLCIHARTRDEHYRDEAISWDRIRRAVDAVSIPVCGNGGISNFAELEAMRRETGCRFVMVGRGAIVDPFLFRREPATLFEAASFLREYADSVFERQELRPITAANRTKMLLRRFQAANLITDDRQAWLHTKDPVELQEKIVALTEPLLKKA